MCTVTIVPSGNSFFITHSRDEIITRERALSPEVYEVNNHLLLFPKDVKGGGTWIAINANGNTVVLLNGGFMPHIPNPRYRKSRGLILLEIIASEDTYQTWQTIQLENIEPFTAILWNNGSLYETRWDGKNRHGRKLNHLERFIWSSTTLYDTEALLKRKNWFEAWLSSYTQPTIQDIIHFHLEGGDGDPGNDICMNRDGNLRTVSLTAVEMTPEKATMKYLDLDDNLWYEKEISFKKSAVENR